jgi:hypothetical protein
MTPADEDCRVLTTALGIWFRNPMARGSATVSAQELSRILDKKSKPT